jgi:FAD:protein FMN transferase
VGEVKSPKDYTRRDFLKLAGLGGVALAIPALSSGFKFSGADSQPYQTSVNAIGTTITFQIEDEIAPAAASLAVGKAAEEIDRLETLLTRFPGGSEIYGLNKVGYLQSPSSDVLQVLRASTANSDFSGGSFDVTVKPVLDLLNAYLAGQPFPSDAQFEAAQSLISYEEVDVGSNFVALTKPGAGVTLDGIATGYIVDAAINSLKSNGIRSALVNAGGTVATIGARGDGSLWEVGISDPMNPIKTMTTLHVRNMAVATSGDYEDFFTPDKTYYHIIDPFTARSPLFSHSATVVAPTAMQADPLGVTLMVDEAAEGVKLIDSTNADCLIYTDGGQIVSTSGMEEMT